MAGAASGANARIGYCPVQCEAIQRRRASLTGVRRRCRYLPFRQRVSAVQLDVTVCAGSHDRDMFERPTAAERRHRMTVGARLIVEQWTDAGWLLCKQPLSLGEPGELIGGEVGAGVAEIAEVRAMRRGGCGRWRETPVHDQQSKNG